MKFFFDAAVACHHSDVIANAEETNVVRIVNREVSVGLGPAPNLDWQSAQVTNIAVPWWQN
jgi:hypothetical protein